MNLFSESFVFFFVFLHFCVLVGEQEINLRNTEKENKYRVENRDRERDRESCRKERE